MKERRKRETSPRTKPTTLHPASALLAPQRVDQRDPIQSFHDAWCSDPGLTVGAWVAGRTVAVILLGRLMTRSGYGRFLEGCKVYQYPPSGKRPHSFNMGRDFALAIPVEASGCVVVGAAASDDADVRLAVDESL